MNHPPKTGSIGEESEWLSFCTLSVRSGKVQIGDADFIPSTDQDLLKVELPPDLYRVEAKALTYGRDRRVSRLRLIRSNVADALIGERIGETWADTGYVGLCDFGVYGKACEDDYGKARAAYEPVFDSIELHGIAVIDEGTDAVMPVVMSGFGDGEFPVFALRTDGSLAGVEVEFIRADEPYPF